MTLFEWTKRIRYRAEKAINTTIGKRLLFLCFAISFMFIGGIIYALISEIIDSPFKKLVFYFSLITGPVTIILLIVDRIFSIENKEKDLQIKERKIDELITDPNTISNQIASNVIPILSNKIKTTDSIYEARERHYSEEKSILANHMYELLKQRILFLRNNGKKNIRILFDSGTTIAPMLDVMGSISSIKNNEWPSNVDIITNNIRGLHYLLKYRKKMPTTQPEEVDDRYIRIPFDCHVLPGNILSAFQAIVGESTFSALNLLKKHTKDYYTISVSTGNYILMDTWNRIFMPIARADLHPHFKAGLYYISDEVYVVGPLGKILKNKNEEQDDLRSLLERFNDDLEYSDKETIESKKRYKLIDPKLIKGYFPKDEIAKINISDWYKKSILVTTTREKGKHFFAPHFELIKSTFALFSPEQGIYPQDASKPLLNLCPFDEIQPWQTNQIELEVPHENLRPFINKYFTTEPEATS